MKIQTHGKQMDVGEALTRQVEERLGEMVAKYSARPIDAVVTFSKDRHEFVCEVTVHLSTGLTAQSRAQANDAYGALGSALERMEKQLRRYKRRLKNHHLVHEAPMPMTPASSYILSRESDEPGTEEPETLQPLIVAEMETPIPSLSVGEAVMQMELMHANVLVFRSDASGNVNVVYRRDDGNIGWIDPRNTRQG